jgi:N-methylhydantoinase B
MIRRIRLLDQEGQYSVLSDRAVIPPWGVLQGGSGKPYALSLERAGEQSGFDTPGKVSGFPIRRGDVVVIRSSGGGGYGDPLERDPERVLDDVKRGYVSAQAAAELYGVVLTDAGEVDLAATASRRAALASERVRLVVRADDALDPYVGAKGRRRIVTLAPGDAQALDLQIDDLVELVGRHPAPLRAWVRIAQTPTGEIRLDPFGRSVLGVVDGDAVLIRRVPVPQLVNGWA